MSPRVWLLDASIYIFRAWFSLPERWHTADGMPLNAVYGYAGFICDFIAGRPPGSRMVAAFDESLGTCFRHQLYPDYKCSRVLPDEALAFQLTACRQLTELSGITCFGGPRYEADDYLAASAAQARAEQLPVTVVTRDKDLGQLLCSDEDCWWDAAADETLDMQRFHARFGVQPWQFASYLALTGDSVDDIPGVPGVGPKTAAALIDAFGDIDTLLANLDQVGDLPLRGARSLGARLAEHQDQIRLAQQLALLVEDIADVRLPAPFAITRQQVDQVVDYLQSLGIEGPLLARWRRLEEMVSCVS